jgi:hypothetical protein
VLLPFTPVRFVNMHGRLLLHDLLNRGIDRFQCRAHARTTGDDAAEAHGRATHLGEEGCRFSCAQSIPAMEQTD